MKTISCTDVIFATIRMRGAMVASLCLSGISSIREVLAKVREALTGAKGIVTLMLRNGSQGWTETRNLVF